MGIWTEGYGVMVRLIQRIVHAPKPANPTHESQHGCLAAAIFTCSTYTYIFHLFSFAVKTVCALFLTHPVLPLGLIPPGFSPWPDIHHAYMADNSLLLRSLELFQVGTEYTRESPHLHLSAWQNTSGQQNKWA